jgi:oxygen-independent coproporphyrinogen-3 oxidase
MAGVNADEFNELFHRTLEDVYGTVLKKYKASGMLEQKGSHIRLTAHGIDVSNVILSEFLLD